jgi:hypothetical protein
VPPSEPQPGPSSRPADANGAQTERTTLAWRRTNLAALTVAAFVARSTHQSVTAVAVFALAFGICAVVGREADRRSLGRVAAVRAWDAGRADARSSVAAPLAVAAAAGLTVGLAVIGIGTVVFG